MSFTIILGFCVISIIFAIVLFYIGKINYNESAINKIKEEIKNMSNDFSEKLNYLKDIYDLRLRVNMLEKDKRFRKKAQINLLDLIKVIVAIILIYVIIQVIKSFL